MSRLTRSIVLSSVRKQMRSNSERHGKREAQREVFNAKLLEIALRENKSEVTGVIVGTHEDVYVKMIVHADGSFTVVEEGKIK